MRKTRALKQNWAHTTFFSNRYVTFFSIPKKERWVLFRSFYNGNFFGNYEKFIYVYTVSLSLGTSGIFSFASHPPPLLLGSRKDSYVFLISVWVNVGKSV